MTDNTHLSQSRSKLRLDHGKKAFFIMLLALFSSFLSVAQSGLTINTQPVKLQRICIPSMPTTPRLQVAAVTCGGANLTYQWQRLRPTSIGGTGNFEDISTSWPGYTGANTPTLDITVADSISGDRSLYKYRCFIVSSFPCFGQAFTNVSEIVGVRKPVVKYLTPIDTAVCESYNGADSKYPLRARIIGLSKRDSIQFTWRSVDKPSFTDAPITAHANYTGWISTWTQSADTVTLINYLTLNAANNTTILKSDDQTNYYLNVFSPACSTADTNTVPKRRLTVNPIQDVAIVTPNINICEGTAFDIKYNVTNATHDSYRSPANIAWSISNFSGDAALIALITTTSGTGDQNITINVPSSHGLSVGVHTVSFDIILNTTDPVSCGRILDTKTITVNVYPKPDVKFIFPSAGDTTICQGTSGIIKFQVTNATFNGTDVSWTVNVTDPDGLLAPTTLTGQGNKTVINTIPTTLGIGSHTVTLNGITTSGTPSGTCTGTVSAMTAISVKVFPTPIATLNTTITEDKCAGSTAVSFSVDVTNAVYPVGPTDLNWVINYTDPTGTITGSFTGTGNGNFPFTTSAALAVGTYTISLNSIALVSPSGALTHPTCSKTLTGQSKVIRVYPNPTATLSSTSGSACEGSTPSSFNLQVSNAVLGATNLAWSVSFDAANCTFQAAATGSPVSVSTALTSVFPSTGSGNGNTTFTPPSNLPPGRYVIVIDKITLANTPSCFTGSLGLTYTLDIFPKPTVAIFGTNMLDSLCEGATSSYSIAVGSAQYAPLGVDRAWSLNYTNALSGTIPVAPITGTGNTTLGAYTTGSGLTTGNYSLTLLTATNTTNSCTATLPGTEGTSTRLTRKIYPKPVASFSTTSINICEGVRDSFNVVITNAVKLPGSVDQPWSLATTGTFEAAPAGSPSVASTALTFPTSGTGNGSTKVVIPSNLPAGRYIFTLANPSLTTSPLNCVGSTTSGTITINIFPKPTLSITPAVDSTCQGIAKTYTVQVGNAYYEPATSTVAWSASYTNQVGAGSAPSLPNGTSTITGSGNTTTTYNTAAISAPGTYTFTINNLNNTTNTCNYNTTASFKLVVKQRPRLVIVAKPNQVCFNTGAVVTYNVDSVAAGQAWSFTYTAANTTPSGPVTVSGVGPVTNATFTTNPFTTTGAGSIVFAPIGLTASGGCASTVTLPTINLFVAGVPNVTSFTTNGNQFVCANANSGIVNRQVTVTVSNMVVGPWTKSWKITGYIRGTQDTSAAAGNQIFTQTNYQFTGVGNGSFVFATRHQTYNGITADAGIIDTRNFIIQKIEFTDSTLMCSNTSAITDSITSFDARPRPRMTFSTNPTHVCVTSPVTLGYSVYGFRTGDAGSFTWNGTNPNQSTQIVNLNGPSIISSAFTTANTVNPGTAIQSVSALVNTTMQCTGLTVLLPKDTTIVDPPSQTGTLSPSYTVCEGNNSGTLSLTGTIVGSVVKWQYSENDGFSWLDFNSTSTSMTFNNATLTRRWRVIVKNLTCPADTSNEQIVFVHPQPKVQIPNYTSGLCVGDSIKFTLSVTGVPTNHTWKLGITKTGFSSGNGTQTLTGKGSGNFTYAFGGMTGSALTGTIQLNTINNDTTNCSNNYSSSGSHLMTIVVGSNSTAGPIVLVGSPNVSLPTTVCYNSNGSVKYTGAGTILYWYQSNKFSGAFPNGWDSTASSSGTYKYFNLDTTTHFRVKVKFGSCAAVISSSNNTINVRPLLGATLTGSDTICEGNTASFSPTINGQANSQVVLSWLEGSTSKSSSFTLGATPPTTFTNGITTGALTTTTSVVLQSVQYSTTPNCPVGLYTNALATVTVNPTPKVTINTVNTPVCQGSTSTVNYSVTGVGSSTNWTLNYKVGSTSLTTSGTGAGTFNLTTPALNASGNVDVEMVSIITTNLKTNCGSGTLSGVKLTIQVDATTTAGSVAADVTVCKGNSATVTLTPGVGSIVKWNTSSSSASGPYSSMSSSSNTFTINNIVTKLWVTATSKNGVCAEATTTTPVVIDVRELPTASISGSTTICSGATATLNVTINNTFGNSWTIDYLEGVTSKTLTGTGSTATITTSNLTTKTDVTLQKITMNNTSSSSNPNCGPTTLSSTVTVDVNPNPTATLNSVQTPVCQSSTANSSFSVTVTGVPTGQGWSLNYTLNGTAQTAVTNAGSGTFTFPLTLNSAGTITLKLTSITNTNTSCTTNPLTGSITADIVVDATTVAGSISNSGASVVCTGTNSGSLTYSGGTGAIVRWEVSSDNGATWTNGGTTSSTFNWSNLTTTTMYRVVVKNGSCLEATSASSTITVRPLPTATISGSTTICQYDSATLTINVSNTFGNTWSVDLLQGTTNRTVTGSGSSATFNSHGLNGKTDFTLNKIVLTHTPSNTNPGGCPNNITSTATVDVNPMPNATIIYVGTPICQGSTSTIQFAVSNVNTGQGWSVNYTEAGVSKTTTGNGPGTYTINTGVLNTTGANVVTLNSITVTSSSPNCTRNLSGQSLTINVDATTTVGSIAGDATVCKGSNSGTLTYSGGNGAIVRWEYSNNGGATWSTTGTTASTYSYSNLTQTTMYRVTVKNSACLEATSASAVITVRDLPTASISGSNTICQGTTGNLTVSVSNSFGNPWSISFLEGTTTRNLTGTGDGNFTLTTLSLSAKTDVTLQSISLTHTPSSTNPGNCANSLSSTATVDVIALPNATLNSIKTPVCQGSTSSFSFTVSNIPTGQGWSMSYTEAGVSKTSTGNGPGTYTLNTSALNTPGKNAITLGSITITSSSPNCTRTLSGQTDTIMVDATTVAGTIAGAATVCKGTNSGTLTYSGGNGSIVRWEYSINSGATWSTTGSTASTFSYSNLTQTTMYRVTVKNSACLEATSAVSTITVRELPTASISGSTTICQNSTVGLTVSVSNTFGNPWTITYLEGTSTLSLNGTGDGNFTLTTSTLTTNTDVTLQSIQLTHTGTSTNPACGFNGLTSTATVNVTPLPTATLNSVVSPICQGNSSSFQFTVSNIATGQGWSMNYTEGSTTKTTTGNGPGTYTVSTSVLSAGTVTITLNSISTTGLSTNCNRNLTGQTMDITVDPTTTVGSLGTDITVCKNSNSGSLTYNVGSSNGAVVRWESSVISASGPWTSISNTTNSQSYINLSQTTFYRVVVKSGKCDEKESNVVTVSIQEIPVAIISGSSVICAGNTATLNISISNVATGQRSVLTYLEGTTSKTVNIFGPTGTITTGILNTNTDITMVSVTSIDSTISSVFRKGCSNSTLTSTATVNVNALPTATLSSVGGPICQGNSTTYTVTVTNVPTGQGWSITGTIEGVAISPAPSGTGSGTFTFNTPVLNTPPSAAVSLTLITNTTTSCTRILTETKSITVDATTTVGSVSGDATVCKGSNAGSVDYAAGSSNGAIVRWEYSTVSPSTAFNGIMNTNVSQTYSNLTTTTFYRAIVKNGACNEVASNVATITVRDLPNATIAGNATICEGQSTNFTITVSKTFGQTFKVYYLIGSKLDSLVATGDGVYSVSTGVLTSTVDISLISIIQISGTPQCSQNLTGTITITVNDLPRASYNNIPSRLCQGSRVSYTIDVSQVKTTQNWSLSYTVKSPSSSTGTTESTSGTGSGTFSITTTSTVLPTTSTITLATVTNTTTGCSRTLSDVKVIDVDPTTIGGKLTTTTNDTVCKGSNSGTLSLVGNTGSVVRWEYSTDNGVTWSTITNTSSSYSYSNLNQTTRIRAIVQSGLCASLASRDTAIIVRDLPFATINNTTICAGNTASLTVTVSNTFGKGWTLTFVEGSTTRTLTGSGDGNFTLTTGILNTTTTISLKSIQLTTGKVLCANTLSGLGVVTVNALPTATHDTAPSSVCDGSTVDFSVNVDDVLAGQSWTLNYRINGGSINTRSGTGPGNFTVTSPVFTNATNTMRVDTIKIVSITNTSTGCTRTATLTKTIEVYPKSIGGTTSATNNTLCANSATTSDITVAGFVGKVTRWEYSDDNGTTWVTLSNTASTITVSNLSVSRLYRAVILSGPCNPANSSTVKITVIPTVQAVITGAPQICAGKTAIFNVMVTEIGANDNWSLTYRVNGTLQTAMTGKGPGNYPLSVGPPTTNTAGTVVVKLETITNTSFNCANNNLTSQAFAVVNPNPIAAFTFSNSCKDSVAVFNNTSTIASGTIADFSWKFGDGATSKDGNPTHAYTATGNYSVSLLAVSAFGCRDSVTQNITVNPRPVADFTFKNTCQDTAVKFTNGSSIGSGSIKSYFWNFGDGSTSTLQNPTHQYAAAGTYTVTLTVVSNNGCAAVKVGNVTVYTLPEPNFVANPVCQNSAMNFVNTSSIGVGSMTYRWDFAGQGNSTLTSPSHTFTGFGSFNVKLTATSNQGCVKILTQPVTVWANPIADFTVADVCIGETSRFINASKMPVGSTDIVQEYFWNFGDSTFSTGKDPLHTYAKDGIFSVTTRATSDKGCINSVTKNAVVHPLPIVQITATATKFCDGQSATLTANVGMRQYQWSTRGTNGDSILGTNQTLVVTKQGWYKVKIWAPSAQGGCSNEDSIFITVWPLPVADAGRDTAIDKGQTVLLKGKGAGLGGSYQWAPTTFLTPSAGNVANVSSKPDNDITYILTVTDRNGCKDDDSVTIKVREDFVLKVHNVVTPNGDGLNDTWIIDNIEAYPNAEVGIFNRYGMEVFKTKGYTNNWDGTYKAPGGENLPDGAYYYVITMEGSDKVYKGALNVLRGQVK